MNFFHIMKYYFVGGAKGKRKIRPSKAEKYANEKAKEGKDDSYYDSEFDDTFQPAGGKSIYFDKNSMFFEDFGDAEKIPVFSFSKIEWGVISVELLFVILSVLIILKIIPFF